MALFRVAELRESAMFRARYGFSKSAQNLLIQEAREFSELQSYDIFLSHSFNDAEAILVLKTLIENMGFSVYVDWVEDQNLDRSSVTAKTADTLRKRMERCCSLFFATSSNSANSRWMPWELGYFDGKKGRVAILPVTDSSFRTDVFKGQEYLGLYPYVTKDIPQGGSKETLWIHTEGNVYVKFDLWLKGNQPSPRI